MSLMTDSFEEFINRFGDNVTILHKIPRTKNGEVLKNDRGRTVYNIKEIPLRCRVKLLKGDEKIVQGGILQDGDGIGLFKLQDGQYINENNRLRIKYTDTIGNDYTCEFKLFKPRFKKTHLICKLKEVEI